MLSLVCVIALFAGQTFATRSADQYADSVVNIALQNVIRSEKIDPTHLADFTFDYKDKTFFGNVNGKAEYSEGTLAGLSKVKRYLDCDGPKNTSSSTIINCTLVFQSLETSHKGKVKYGVLPKVTIQGKGYVQSLYIKAGIVKSFIDRNPSVKTFSVVNAGSMTANFTGLGPLNKHTKVLEGNYITIVGAEVNKAITNRFRYALNLAVASLPMPLN